MKNLEHEIRDLLINKKQLNEFKVTPNNKYSPNPESKNSYVDYKNWKKSGNIPIPGTDLTIEATNITLSATAEFKSEGSASAEISSGGATTVKGSLVQIN